MKLVATTSKSYPRFRLKLSRFLLGVYLFSLSGGFFLQVFHYIDHNFQVPSFVLEHKRGKQQIDWSQITMGKSEQQDSMVHQFIELGAEIGLWNSGDKEKSNPISTSPTIKLDQHYTSQSLALPIFESPEGTRPIWCPVSPSLNSYVQLLFRPPRLKA